MENLKMIKILKSDSPAINPCIYSRLIYDKKSQDYTLVNKWCWEKWTATCNGMQVYPNLTPYKKKSIQNGLGLNIRLKIIKLLKENKDNKLLYISLSDAVSDLTPKQRQKSTNK